MTRMTLISLLAIAFSASAQAACPPLSRYDVSGVSFRGATLETAVERLLAGTPWKAEFDGPATDIRLSLVGVSGPLGAVLDRVIDRVGKGPVVESVSTTIDREACVVRVHVQTVRPTPSILVEEAVTQVLEDIELNASREPTFAEREHVLPQGQKLSEALGTYVGRHGWTLRWRISDDYLIDTAIPIPPGDVIAGVLHVIRAYQTAGAMQTVRPRFATSNHVVVIESAGDQ